MDAVMMTGAERRRSAGYRPERGCAGVGGAAACPQGRGFAAPQAHGLALIWRSAF